MNKNLMVPEGANAEPKEILHNIEAGGGSDVIANPTLEGGEELLGSLQVGEEKYKVTTVTEGTGWMDDEPFFHGLEINGVKKRIPAGKTRLFKHTVTINLDYFTDDGQPSGYEPTLKGYIITAGEYGSDQYYSWSDILPLFKLDDSVYSTRTITNIVSTKAVIAMSFVYYDDQNGRTYIMNIPKTGLGLLLDSQSDNIKCADLSSLFESMVFKSMTDTVSEIIMY